MTEPHLILPFAQTITGLDSVVFGIAILFVAFWLRRSAARSNRSRNRDLVAEVRGEFLQQEKQGASKLEKLEIRLYDYSREVEARIETRIALLDQLVAAADEETTRLESQLKLYVEHAENAETNPPTPEQRRMIAHLAGAGFKPSEIANLTDRPEAEIQTLLNDKAA